MNELVAVPTYHCTRCAATVPGDVAEYALGSFGAVLCPVDLRHEFRIEQSLQQVTTKPVLPTRDRRTWPPARIKAEDILPLDQ